MCTWLDLGLGLANAVEGARTWPEWDPNVDPDQKHNDPRDEERNRIRKHRSKDGSNTGFTVIFLRKNDDNRQIRHQRRNDIRDRVTNAVRRLGCLWT